jgi:anti-sigma-K factor RskA
MTCEEFEELSGAFVLGAVTPEEFQAAQEHLATCASCTRLAQELRSVVNLLPLSVPQVAPSPALKDRVLEAVRQEQQTQERQQLHLAPQHSRARRNPRDTRQRPLVPRRMRWTTRLLAVAALVMFALFGGMTAWNVSLQHQVTTLQSSNTRLTGQLGQLQQANSSQAKQINALHQQIAQVFALSGTKPAQNATGSLLYIPQQNITVLVLHNLPQLSGQQIYQGWLLHNNVPVSIGVLSEQNGVASLTFPGTISGFQLAAISREPGPAPSKNAPVGPVVAAGQLSHPTQVLYSF